MFSTDSKVSTRHIQPHISVIRNCDRDHFSAISFSEHFTSHYDTLKAIIPGLISHTNQPFLYTQPACFISIIGPSPQCIDPASIRTVNTTTATSDSQARFYFSFCHSYTPTTEMMKHHYVNPAHSETLSTDKLLLLRKRINILIRFPILFLGSRVNWLVPFRGVNTVCTCRSGIWW